MIVIWEKLSNVLYSCSKLVLIFVVMSDITWVPVVNNYLEQMAYTFIRNDKIHYYYYLLTLWHNNPWRALTAL